jgi:23S rRNA (uracil1939-C5)-methyltransferase
MIGMPVDEAGVPRHFRQKAAFTFTEDDRGRLQIGHFARGTHTVVPVTECLVHSPRANQVAFAIKDAMAAKKVPVATERGGLLRHVVVRVTEDQKEAVAVVVATEEHPVLQGPLKQIAGSKAKPDGLLLNLHDQASPYLFGPHTVRVDGLGHVKETALGPSFLSSPTGFFQTNIVGAAHLVRLVKAAIGPAKPSLRVLDLYSGSGLFSLPLAMAGHSVTAVEESRKASREAGKNARLSGVPESRLRLMPSKVEEAIEHLVRQEWDAAVIDPPRSGSPEGVMRTLCRRIAPRKLVIVSCNPEGLMNELRIAHDAGYRISLVQPVDMFPHTPHIETVAVLELKHRARTVARTERSAARPGERSEGPRPPREYKAKPAKPRPAKPWDRMPKRGGRGPVS